MPRFTQDRIRVLFCLAFLMALAAGCGKPGPVVAPGLEARQLTFGPKHHIFGYIGHVRTIPWNRSGRYIVALEIDFQDRMPGPADAARIILLDTTRNYATQVVDETRGWNPQQGTMLYWNPQAPETQFFFNDRDPDTGKVFCVLFDISQGEHGRRVREYRFADTPIGNSGVAQQGGYFLGINYARMARLRPVTGYPGATDWTIGVDHPADDGVFKVDVNSGEKKLLVSFKQLADVIRPGRPDVDGKALFINHTLWNREGNRIFFFARADFGNRKTRINVPFTIRPDGKDLAMLGQFIGGHPEWDSNNRMIGAIDDRQVIYDIDRQEVVDTLGSPEIFPNPGGDIALSPNGEWLCNGSDSGGKNYYVFLRRSDGFHLRSEGFDRGEWTSGDLRIDAAPCWNREGNEVLFTALAQDPAKTRQLFMIRLRP